MARRPTVRENDAGWAQRSPSRFLHSAQVIHTPEGSGREAFGWSADEPRHHLHVLAADSPELRRRPVFRDYLRTHPGVAREYGELKRRLAERFREDREAYTEGKTEFVVRVL